MPWLALAIVASLCTALPAQKKAAAPPASAIEVEAWSRNPETGDESRVDGVNGEVVGTVGLGRDIFRLRIGGRLPDGVRLAGTTFWTDKKERPLRFGVWSSDETQDIGSLCAARFHLEGPNAYRYALHYSAHVAYRGDTRLIGATELLGQRGRHRFAFQAIRILIQPRTQPVRRLFLAIEEAHKPKATPDVDVVALVVWREQGKLRFREVTLGGSNPNIEPGRSFAMSRSQHLVDATLRHKEWIAAHVILIRQRGKGTAPPDAALLGLDVESRRTLDARRRGRGHLGAFTVHMSLNGDGALQVQFGALPNQGKVRHDASSNRIGGHRAARFTMPGGVEMWPVVRG